MSGKGESASEAHQVTSSIECGTSAVWSQLWMLWWPYGYEYWKAAAQAFRWPPESGPHIQGQMVLYSHA